MFGYCLGGADPAERGRGAARPRQFLQNRGTNLPRGRVISRARSELDGHAPDHAVVERPRAARALDPAVQHAEVEDDALPVVTEAEADGSGAGLRHAALLLLAQTEAQRPGIAAVVELAAEPHRDRRASSHLEPIPVLLRAAADRGHEPHGV